MKDKDREREFIDAVMKLQVRYGFAIVAEDRYVGLEVEELDDKNVESVSDLLEKVD